MNELLDATASHSEELERFKLQMMVQDTRHRKNLLLLRVAGLSKMAPYFKYFRNVVPRAAKERTRKESLKERIVFEAMVSNDYA